MCTAARKPSRLQSHRAHGTTRVGVHSGSAAAKGAAGARPSAPATHIAEHIGSSHLRSLPKTRKVDSASSSSNNQQQQSGTQQPTSLRHGAQSSRADRPLSGNSRIGAGALAAAVPSVPQSQHPNNQSSSCVPSKAESHAAAARQTASEHASTCAGVPGIAALRPGPRLRGDSQQDSTSSVPAPECNAYKQQAETRDAGCSQHVCSGACSSTHVNATPAPANVPMFSAGGKVQAPMCSPEPQTQSSAEDCTVFALPEPGCISSAAGLPCQGAHAAPTGAAAAAPLYSPCSDSSRGHAENVQPQGDDSQSAEPFQVEMRHIGAAVKQRQLQSQRQQAVSECMQCGSESATSVSAPAQQ